MNFNLVLLPEAQDDIIECAEWITSNQDPTGKLANDFIDAIEQTLERLKGGPELNAIRHDDVRGIHVRRDAPKGQPRNFPHIIFYRFTHPDIVVVQIFPMRDNPEKIR